MLKAMITGALIALVGCAVLIRSPVYPTDVIPAPIPSTTVEVAVDWPGMVAIHNMDGWGTGFVVAPGFVLTVGHASDAPGRLFAGHTRATIVKIDLELDLALLRVPGVEGPVAQFNDMLNVGELVWVVRYVPWSRQAASLMIHRGHVVMQGFDGRTLIKTTMHPGMSGSPVMNVKGEVVGVLFAILGGWHSDNPRIGILVTVADITNFIEGEIDAVQQPDTSGEGSTPRGADGVGVEVPGPGCETLQEMAY